VELALTEAERGTWDAAVPEGDVAPAAEAPLLHGTVIRIDPRPVRRLLRALLHEAATSGDEDGVRLAKARARKLDALGLLQAALTRDTDAIDRLGTIAGIAPDALGALVAVAQLAATPLRHACERQWRERIPATWMNGYCPICGGWPVMAELRGIERNRRLRCGGCGGDWPLPVLHCPFCAEVRHDQLGSLLLEGEEQRRRIDICRSCKGYVKTFNVLRPRSLRALATDDLASIELDIVAHEHGYERPSHNGYAIAVAVERAAARPKQAGLET
jgi:FdhE protein